MSDSVRPHRRQPIRLPCLWDFPGKSTGVGCHFLLQCMKVKSEREVVQSYPTLSDPLDCSPPGCFVHRIFQARVLEWGATAFSNTCRWKVKGKSLSRARLLATPWTAAYQAALSIGFPRQECWSGLPLPSPLHVYTPKQIPCRSRFIIFSLHQRVLSCPFSVNTHPHYPDIFPYWLFSLFFEFHIDGIIQ